MWFFVYVKFVVKWFIPFIFPQLYISVELSHTFNLIWDSQKSCEVYVVHPWNQISDKGQVFMYRKPRPQPDCKLHRKDNTNTLPNRKRLHHATQTQRGPHIPSSSQLTWVCWWLSGTQSGLTRHHLLILSAVRARAAFCLSDPMLGDLHSNKEQLTCFTTRHEEKKLHSGHPGIFGGRGQTHIFPTRKSPFSHRRACEWLTLLLVYVCYYYYIVKGFWCCKNVMSRILHDHSLTRGPKE